VLLLLKFQNFTDACQGKSYQEALSNAERMIDDWIETATSLGRPIHQPKGRLAYA
jgi:predicted RNase H-like HicB family nuclease